MQSYVQNIETSLISGKEHCGRRLNFYNKALKHYIITTTVL